MIIPIISFIFILGLLIFVHEFGHFITAKKSGVHVDEFGFGFPPRIWGKKGKDGVIYSINWIPLGGFVKIKGQDGEKPNDPDSFANKSFSKRALILSAGVLMNIILAFFLISVGFMFGLPAAIDDQDIKDVNVRDVKVQISEVLENSPASEQGLMTGFELLKVDDQEITSSNQLADYIKQFSGNSLTLTVKDNSKPWEVVLEPREIENFSEGKVIGVTLIKTGIVKYGFLKSWYMGLITTWNLLIAIILAFYVLFRDLFIGLGLSSQVSGPVGVAVMTGRVVGLGWSYILQFMAILSINLAVLNFLPFPALDGGRFLFLVIEKIRRKPNNQKIEAIVHNSGFALLMLLVVFITYRDIIRYGGGMLDKIKELF